MSKDLNCVWTEEDERKYSEYKQIVEDFLRPIDDAIDRLSRIERELELQRERQKKLLDELHELGI